MGCDGRQRFLRLHTSRFNSRTPRGVRPTNRDGICYNIKAFQFTHPAWGATRKIHRHTMTRIVSIHAPRVGCDAIKGVFSCVSVDVSIHAPRVGCDIHNPAILRFSCEFQFTHPAWGATSRTTFLCETYMFQFTHPAWGATA